MESIDGRKNLPADKIKQFLSAEQNDVITVKIDSFGIDTTNQKFVDDLFSDILKDAVSDDKDIICTNGSTLLLLAKQDYDWYHGSSRKLTNLKKKVYDEQTVEVEAKPKQRRLTNRQMMLRLEEEAMLKQRIVAVMLNDDVKTIQAYQGDGYECTNWLNHQIVKATVIDKTDNIKFCINFSQLTVIDDFKTVEQLVEEGGIRL